MKLFKRHKVIFFTFVALIIGVFFILCNSFNIKGEKLSVVEALPVSADINSENQKSFFQPPEEVKAIYVTSWSASRNSYIDYLIDIAKNTEINSVVIDIKDWSGYVGYNTSVPEVEKYGAKSIRIKDIASFIQKLHNEGIYVIGRIAVFQDPVLARARPDLAIRSQSNKLLFSPVYFLSSLLSSLSRVATKGEEDLSSSPSPFSLWFDRLGLTWIDPTAKECWDYNIAIAKDALDLGFDEINFDYVRFPSDGDLKDMVFPFWDKKTPRNLIIKEFFEYLRQKLPDTKLSIDLFGLTTVSSNDLGVGQIIEDVFEYFDYVCPMVYPSHYADGFLGFENPADYPYEVVNYSTKRALQRLSVFNQSQKSSAQIRPWLQDFNLGAIYDASMVRKEIQAVYDASGDDFNGFMLWNSSNFYTEEALKLESQ